MTDREPPAPAHPAARRRRRLGLRTEIVILLPVATLVLVALSAFTLFSFRGAMQQLLEDRRLEAARVARDLSGSLASEPNASTEALRRLAPFARAAAIGNERGAVLAKIGDLQDSDLLAPLDGIFPTAPVATGPNDELPGAVAAFAPFGPPGARRLVRVDLAATTLYMQNRGLVVLTWVVVSLDLGLALLMIAFLRYALQPYDALLARARAATGPPQPGDQSGIDEIDFLMQTFDRALHSLANAGKTGEDDIAALERALAPSLESGLLLLDREGGVLALNPTGETVLGLAPPAVGVPYDTALAVYPELVAHVTDALSTGRGVQRAECTIALPGSPPRIRTLGLTVHPLRRDDGGVRGFLILFADLTDARKRDEENRLAESLERIGELAAGVAHEMRNSLATLRGYLTLIERRPDEEKIADYLGEMRHETDHLQRVLEDFLAFARPGSTRLEEVDLAAVVRRAVTDPALGGAAIALDLQVPGAALLRGDAQLLERAVRNLLHNAVQAEATSPENSQVEAHVRRTAEGLELEIADRGPGLPPEVLEHLFHPFVSGRPGGVGLGLALAHRIVDLHGGRIRLEQRPGGGTQAFVLFLEGSSPASS